MIAKKYLIAIITVIIILFITKSFWISTEAFTDEYNFSVFSHFLQPIIDSVIKIFPKISQLKIYINFELLIILTVISCFGTMLLLNYLSDIRTKEKASISDIIFLTVFFILLFIPMSHIDNSKFSLKENRPLAKFNPLINKGKINYEFTNEFESWFNDRFYLRNSLLLLDSKLLKRTISWIPGCGVVYLNKKNNYIFTNNDNDFDCWLKPEDEEYEQYSKTYEKLKNYCEKNNIKLYIIAVPTKEKALIKFQDKRIQTWEKETERAFYIKQYLEKYYPESNIIYPLKDMKNIEGAYYKTDHHYTEYGASIVANVLFNEMQKDNIFIKNPNNIEYFYDKMPHETLNDNKFDGYLYTRLNLSDEKIFDVKYKYFDLSKTNMQIAMNTKAMRRVYINPEAPNDYKVFIIGDSFTHSMGKYLAYYFKKVVVRRDNMPDYELYADSLLKDVEEEKPSILIFVYIAPQLDRFFKTFYTGDGRKKDAIQLNDIYIHIFTNNPFVISGN